MVIWACEELDELNVGGIRRGELRDVEVTIWKRRLMWKEGVIKFTAGDKHTKGICEEIELKTSKQ